MASNIIATPKPMKNHRGWWKVPLYDEKNPKSLIRWDRQYRPWTLKVRP